MEGQYECAPWSMFGIESFAQSTIVNKFCSKKLGKDFSRTMSEFIKESIVGWAHGVSNFHPSFLSLSFHS